MCWLGAGPSLMPGGTPEAYQHIEPIVQAVAAQVLPSPAAFTAFWILLPLDVCDGLPMCLLVRMERA